MKVLKKIDKRNKKKPDLTVLCSYYNNENTIKKSLNSIFNQTLNNFEVIIYSDGSNDFSDKIVNKIIKNKRNVLFLKSNKNLGLTKSLNYILKFARGEFIARHDTDDISKKNRFINQVNFLKKNKDIHVLGTNSIHISNKRKFIKMPKTNFLIKRKLPQENVIIHSSVIILKKILKKYKYNEKFLRCQDYELWLRVRGSINFFNLQEYLVIRQIRKNQFTLNDLYYSSLARFKHINIFEALIYGFKDLAYFLTKKIIF